VGEDGERCVEISRKVESYNYTLDLLLSMALNGAENYNIIDRPTNTVEFSWNFFEEAAHAANITTGFMDNLAVHHYEGGEVLEEYLANMGVKLIFTPT